MVTQAGQFALAALAVEGGLAADGFPDHLGSTNDIIHLTAIGGPLAHVRNGDRIRLSVASRALELLVSDEELARRRTSAPLVEPSAPRGYRKLYPQSVLQAGEGVDFDFLRAAGMHGSVPSSKP